MAAAHPGPSRPASYFWLDADPSFDEIKAIIDYYPVFRIAYER